MKPADIWLLAKTKFKARKLRSVVTSIIIAISLVLLVGFAVATTGLTRSVQTMFKDPLIDRYFAEEQFYATGKEPKPPTYTDQEYRSKYSGYNIINIYREAVTYSYEPKIVGDKLNNQESRSSFGLVAMDPVFAEASVPNLANFEYHKGQPIPLIVPGEYIAALNDKPFKDQTERNQYIRGQVDNYVGKTTKLSFNSLEIHDASGSSLAPAVRLGELEFKIVGIAAGRNEFIVPYQSLANASLGTAFKAQATSLIVSEFESAAERDRFVNDLQKPVEPCMDEDCVKEQSFISQRYSIFQGFTEILNIIQTVLRYIAGVLGAVGAILIMTTLGRIVAESKREIGVFRAIGAKKSHIRGIFLLYATFLVTLGFMIALGLAYLGNLFLSLKFAPVINEHLKSFGNNLEAEPTRWLTMGLPVKELVALYLLSIVIGTLAALLPAWKATRVDPIKALRSE